MTSYVFDSYPLLKLFQQERNYKTVLQLLETIIEKNQKRFLHIINFAEIIYLVKKRFGEAEKLRVISAIYDLGFEIIPATDAIVYQAAELKGSYPISFGDCFALATAINQKAVLVTGDTDFRKVEKLIEVHWV